MRLAHRLLYTFVVCLFALSCTQEGQKENKTMNFKLNSLDNDRAYTLSDFSDKAVVLNFWASWCAPCKEELPVLQEMSEEFDDKKVQFLGINVMDDRKDAISLRNEYELTYPNLYDEDGKVSDMYGVTALPVTVFIDKRGNIIQKQFGPFLGEEGYSILKNKIKGLIH